MVKRVAAFILTVILILSLQCQVFACNESQTDTYVLQVLFGDNAVSRESDSNAKMLLDALYLCSEQSNGLGTAQINELKTGKVGRLPSISSINIKENSLLDCSHNTWEYESTTVNKAQSERKKLLQNTVNKVLDFGFINGLFGRSSGKCNSFSAVLYYTHILSDYLADDPSETETTVRGKTVSSYAGQPYVAINGNNPSFSSAQKKSTEPFVQFSPLDSMNRCGVAFANVCPDNLPPPGSRQDIGMIRPSGWNQKRYDGIVNSEPAYLYNRCHLIAHELVGEDSRINLITGTRYLNETGMKPFEDLVAKYVRDTGNHVLYRATPVFEGENEVASGVQLEAYSVEDSGKGICFNVYCYNVQPGVEINYSNGKNELSDITFESNNIIPFAVFNAGENNPDLIYEMNKHLAILFAVQKNSSTYSSLMSEISAIAIDARNVGNKGENAAQRYLALKEYEYKYFNVLKSYVPLLLEKESFFNKTFK